MKFSGDGARFSNTSSYILLSFSLPEDAKDALAGSGTIHMCICTCTYLVTVTVGNHTFAIVKASEEYKSLRDSLTPVLDELNLLLCEKKIEVNRTSVELDFVFGSDLKVHVHVHVVYTVSPTTMHTLFIFICKCVHVHVCV